MRRTSADGSSVYATNSKAPSALPRIGSVSPLITNLGGLFPASFLFIKMGPPLSRFSCDGGVFRGVLSMVRVLAMSGLRSFGVSCSRVPKPNGRNGRVPCVLFYTCFFSWYFCRLFRLAIHPPAMRFRSTIGGGGRHLDNAGRDSPVALVVVCALRCRVCNPTWGFLYVRLPLEEREATEDGGSRKGLPGFSVGSSWGALRIPLFAQRLLFDSFWDMAALF